MSDIGSCRLPVDHVGILGESAEDLAQTWRRLGFNVVGPAELLGVDDEGAEGSLGQQSAHIMFERDYIELTSVYRPHPDHHLARFLNHPDGIRLIILSTDDIEATRRHCEQAKLSPGKIQRASREITYGAGGNARFQWFALPAGLFPEALVCFVQHLTMELVFEPSVAQHPNGACGLSRLIFKGSELPGAYQHLASGDNGLNVEARTAQQANRRFATSLDNGPPFAVLGVRVADVDQTGALLEASGVQHWRVNNAIKVAPSYTGGVGLVFESRASGSVSRSFGSP